MNSMMILSIIKRNRLHLLRPMLFYPGGKAFQIDLTWQEIHVINHRFGCPVATAKKLEDYAFNSIH